MATKIPKDLEKYGGWEFTEPFQEYPLEVGQIWRKCGPVDAIKIKSIILPEYPDYDGGLNGISVRFSRLPSNATSVSWAREGSFISGNYERIMKFFKENGYALANKTDLQKAS